MIAIVSLIFERSIVPSIHMWVLISCFCFFHGRWQKNACIKAFLFAKMVLFLGKLGRGSGTCIISTLHLWERKLNFAINILWWELHKKVVPVRQRFTNLFSYHTAYIRRSLGTWGSVSSSIPVVKYFESRPMVHRFISFHVVDNFCMGKYYLDL